MSINYDNARSLNNQAQGFGSIGAATAGQVGAPDLAGFRAEQEAARLAHAVQMQADRDSQRRTAALEAALRNNSGRGISAHQVVSDACEFEAFLKGAPAEAAQ